MKPTLTHDTKTCPIQKLACILSDVWTILIIRDLIQAPLRFSQLEVSLSGISSRTLTLKLQKLAEEGIITHEDHLYTITKKGVLLKPLIDDMAKIGKKM